MSEQRLKLAIQKSGRLSEDSRQLIKDCGIAVSSYKGTLVSKSRNFPLEYYFLRDDDIPKYVEDGTADLGIVGENVLAETESDVEVVKKLGFSQCRLALAIPRGAAYPGISHFHGKKIATSYPVILKKYLQKNNIDADIHLIKGSVEIAPNIGLADGILDIVSTGSTLLSNGLKEVEKVMESEAILIASKSLSQERQKILDKLQFRIDAVLQAQSYSYILLNSPNDNIEQVINLLPGMKSPTVLPLATPGWSSVHSVIKENEYWDIIAQLKEVGAQGILVIPVEKMIL